MAYVARSRPGRWEIRESRATPAGPRSRTLATFSELTGEVIERARSRAAKPIDADELRQSALRAGAPLPEPAADRAARELLGELAAGRSPRPGLGALLGAALTPEVEPSDSARSAAAWINATPEQRGEALRELLLLADRLPAPARGRRNRFPRLESA